MLRLFLLIMFLPFIKVHATSMVVSCNGEVEFLFDADQEMTLHELKQMIEEQTGVSVEQQYLLIEGQSFSKLKESEEFITFSVEKEKDANGDDPVRIYEKKVTEEEHKDIDYIVTTLGNASIPTIGWKADDLNKAGDRILHLHPFRFLEDVFTHDATIVAVKNIRDRSFSMPWKKFTKKQFKTLDTEAKRENIDQYVSAFAESLIIDENLSQQERNAEKKKIMKWIESPIKKRKWKKLLNNLIDNIKRPGNPDGYDF